MDPRQSFTALLVLGYEGAGSLIRKGSGDFIEMCKQRAALLLHRCFQRTIVLHLLGLKFFFLHFNARFALCWPHSLRYSKKSTKKFKFLMSRL